MLVMLYWQERITSNQDCNDFVKIESFHVKHSDLVDVHAWTDPDFSSFGHHPLLIILDREANWRRCLHSSVTASDGMTQYSPGAWS